MLKLPFALGVSILGLALLVGAGTSQDKVKDKEPPPKGQLPPGWKNLGLSKGQVEQIYTIQTKFKVKLKALEEQIKELRTQEKSDMVKVLTDEQKTALVKLTTGESPKDKDKEKDKK